MSENNNVTFNSIVVNLIENNAGIFVGTNSQSCWNSNSNRKSGFGVVLGIRNSISQAVNIFMDNDVVDTPIITNNYNGVKQPMGANYKNHITVYGCRRGKKEEP